MKSKSVDTKLAIILAKPWRRQTPEERLYVAAHDRRQLTLFIRRRRNSRKPALVTTCRQCGARLCTGGYFCDAICRHAYDLQRWGDGRPVEQPTTQQLQLSLALASDGYDVLEVRRAVLQPGTLTLFIRRDK